MRTESKRGAYRPLTYVFVGWAIDPISTIERPGSRPYGALSLSLALAGAAAASGGILVALLPRPGTNAAMVVVGLLTAYAGLACLLATRDPRGRTVRRVVVGLGAVVLLAAVLRPPSGSHDVWSYAMYGRIVSVHHASPYRWSPAHFAHDPIFRRVDPLWRHSRSVYGPMFAVVAFVVTRVAGSSPTHVRLGFQLVAAASVVAAAVLVHRRTGGDSRALAMIVLNPLVVCSVVNDAHIDALVALGVLVGVLLLERRRPAAAGVAFALASLVKIIAILPAGGIALWLLLDPRRRRSVLPFVFGLVGPIVLGYAFVGGSSALAPLFSSSLLVTRGSVWSGLRLQLLGRHLGHGLAGRQARHTTARTVGRLATLLVVIATSIGVLLRGRRTGPAAIAGGAILAYLVLGAYVLPWYAVTAIFCLAIDRRWPLTAAVLALAALDQIAEVPSGSFVHFARHHVAYVPSVWRATFQTWGLPAVEVAVLVWMLVLLRSRTAPAEEA